LDNYYKYVTIADSISFPIHPFVVEMARRMKRRSGRRIRSDTPKSRMFSNKFASSAMRFAGAHAMNYAKRKASGALKSAMSRKRRKGSTGRKIEFAPVGDRSNGGTGDRTYLNRNIGRRLRPLKAAVKLSRLVSDSRVYRFQNLAPYADPVGAYTMNRWQASANNIGAVGSIETMPVYLFELTNIGTNGQSPYVQAGYRLNKRWLVANNNDYSFTAVPCQAPAGSTLINPGYYIVEQQASQPNSHIARDMLEWVQIKLDCVSPTGIPCKWSVSLVQFTENYYQPEWINNADPDQQQARDEFWDNIVQPLIAHPYSVQNTRMHKTGMKVLKRVAWTTNPKQSIDTYNTGEEKLVKIFKWMNRAQRYDWSQPGEAPGPSTTGVEQTGFTQNFAVPEAQVTWKARVYLMVTCEHFGPMAGWNAGNEIRNAATTGSFDLCIRKKHVGPLSY